MDAVGWVGDRRCGGATGVILQARLGSARFPGKILQKIGPLTILEHSIQTVRRIAADHHIIATDPQSYAVLARYATAYGIDIIAGPATDVLQRFVQAARTFALRTIVRATADNPFASARYANRALALFRQRRCDYCHYADLPLGGGVEILTRSALTAAALHARTAYDREHVTPYIYRHPERFAVVHAEAFDRDYSHLRITVDSKQDWRDMIRLFARCRTPRIELDTIIAQHPDVHA